MFFLSSKSIVVRVNFFFYLTGYFGLQEELFIGPIMFFLSSKSVVVRVNFTLFFYYYYFFLTGYFGLQEELRILRDQRATWEWEGGGEGDSEVVSTGLAVSKELFSKDNQVANSFS